MAILASLPVVVAALVVPLILWLIWYHSERLVYRGPAVVVSRGIDMHRVRPERSFVVVVLPDQQRILADVPIARATAIGSGGKSVEVELRTRPLFGRLHVESIRWEPNGSYEKAEQRFDGMLPSLYYLVLGIALISHPLTLLSAVAVAVSGFLVGGVARSDIDYTRTPFASRLVLWVWLVVSGIATVFLFQIPGLHLLFPGVLVAFVFGQLLGMMGQYWGQNDRAGH